MPVHLLSTAGLLVRAGEVLYAIATDDIEQVVVLEPGQLQTQRGTPMGTLPDGSTIPVVSLASMMSRPSTQRAKRVLALVIARGTRRLGLAVDGLVREQQYVTQRLPWNLAHVAGVNGTTVLEDGTVAVSVDAGGLFELARDGGHPSTAVAAESSRSGRLPRVLVADDSLTARVLARNILAAAGYRVTLTEDGSAAWALLQKEPFDLVVSDVQMPIMDGLELTRRIRNDQNIGKLPVVLVTQLGEPEDVARGREAGANEYLVKGKLDRRSLLAAVSRLL
jgi:two-component system chemotaxis sensor kinase CheA